MKKPLLVILLCVFMYGVGQAQVQSDFTYTRQGSIACDGTYANFTFTSTSTGNTTTHWDFGDGAQADNPTVQHIYYQPGNYTVRLVAGDAGNNYDTITKQVLVNSLTLNYSHKYTGSTCSKAIQLFSANIQSAFPDSLSYAWLITGGTPGYLISSNDSSVTDSFNTPANVSVSVTVTSRSGNYCSYQSDTSITTAMPVLPSKGANVLVANRQCTNDFDGWTNYYYDNNTPDDESDDSLVLSLRLHGEDIGTIGDGTFSVKIAATPGAGSDSAVLVTNPVFHNPPGFWAMNRYWSVIPTRQPTQQVQVRFYFNNQDWADVKSSYERTSAYKLGDVHSAIFYKTVNGNPDPATNLAGTDSVILIQYTTNVVGDVNDYIDFNVYNPANHVAEFAVTSLSGGGGGFYKSDEILPVQLTSFTANNSGNKVSLQWTTAQEINVSKYNVQVSADGRQFTTLGSVAAHGKTSADAYAFSYDETKLAKAYYRLQVVEKNGMVSGSNIVPLSFARENNTITLYPNPAKNSVQVKAAGFENKWATAIVYNAAGAKVITANLYFTGGTATLNTASLASGHYTVVLRNEHNVTHVPLVIVK